MFNLQKAIQRELSLFVDAISLDGGSIPEVSKVAFCKARKKLKPEAFIELSEVILEEYYKSSEYTKWKGYRLLGVDGSTVELPNSEEIQEHFGVFKTRNDGKVTCMGRTEMIYDTLNHMTIQGKLSSIEKSETEILWEMLSEFKPGRNDLMIFDRYYASQLLFLYLNHRKINFCFRMKKDWWKIVEEFNKTGLDSQVIDIELPLKYDEKANELGIRNKKIKVRLVKIELETGETEILLTSLLNSTKYSNEDLSDLYSKRWPIEESYKTFKHKVCIENFTGKSLKSVQQDFFIKIFIMNLTAAAINPINDALKKKSSKVKYDKQVNVIEAIATFKRAVVSFFLMKKIKSGLKRLFDRFSRILEPIRPDRKFERNKQPKRKYHMNYKPV